MEKYSFFHSGIYFSYIYVILVQVFTLFIHVRMNRAFAPHDLVSNSHAPQG